MMARALISTILVVLFAEFCVAADTTSPLFDAVAAGRETDVQLLLQQGSDVNAKDFQQQTPLMIASEKGNLNIVRMLIHAGADVNASREDGATALLLASRDGHMEVVLELIQAGADVKKNGPVLLASRDGHADIVHALLTAGANANVPTGEITPLMEAAGNGHSTIVRDLLQAGANVNARDADGSNALMIAVAGNHADVLRALLDSHATVNEKLPDGTTGLMIAARNGNAEITTMLMKAGADVKQKDSSGKTAMYWAIWSKNAATISALSANAEAPAGLMQDLRSADPNVRYSAATALGLSGNRQAVGPMLEMLKTEHDDHVRLAIVNALGLLGDQHATGSLLSLAHDRKISGPAIEAIAKIKDRSAVPTLRKEFWNSRNSEAAMNALFLLSDGAYISLANRWRGILALGIPLLILLTVAVLALFTSRYRKRELFRISIAGANAGIGFMLGFSLLFLGFLLGGFLTRSQGGGGEWAAIAYLSIGYLFGLYCAFFSALVPFLTIKGWKSFPNALVVAAIPLLLSPVALLAMSRVFTQTNEAVRSPLSEIQSLLQSGTGPMARVFFAIVLICLGLFLDFFIVSLPLRRLNYEPAFTFRQFVLIVLGIAVVFLLQEPLARLIVSALY